jgi:ethanolamine utilization protein EutQ
MATNSGITLHRPDDVETWHRSGERRIFVGDVVDASNSDSMSVGFARYAPGESNEWLVTYDEALVVTRGTHSVTSADGVKTTAKAGEVIFLRKGTRLVYSAEEDGADVVYVSYPHWIDAQEGSEHAHLLDTFQPSDDPPETGEPVTLLRQIYEPLARGESDLGPFFDALADDVEFRTPVGTVHGRQAVIDYFEADAAALEVDPFVRPLEYYADGNRVVVLGDETFRVRQSGATHRAEWAWVHDVRDGLITRITAIQHLGPVAEHEAGALSGTESPSDRPARDGARL